MLKLMEGSAPKRADDLSTPEHRRLLGLLGFFLPLILIVLACWRDGWDAFLRLDSVSAYYYTGAVSAFAGMLIAFSLVLFTYRGYRDESGKPDPVDRRCAIAGALAALGVALFPTSAPGGFQELPWVTPLVVKTHFFSAVVLFGIFAVFCLWLFRKKSKEDMARQERGEKPDAQKEGRNAVYSLCGVVIVACIVWAFYERWNDRSIFWPESVALMFFSISWLVKGYADTPWVRGTSWLSHRLLSLLTPKPGAANDESPSNR